MTQVENIAGIQFGKLTAIAFAGHRYYGGKSAASPLKRRPQWHCRCDCGKDVVATVADLKREEYPRSCGCSRKKLKLHSPHFRVIDDSPALILTVNQRRVIAGYKRAADLRCRDWEISDELAMSLFAGDCHYCGLEPDNCQRSYTLHDQPFWYSGIDRKDNDLGYLPDNVVSCCITCNRAKGSTPYLEFIERCDRMARFRSQLRPLRVAR